MTPRVGLLYRREWDPPASDEVDVATCRLHGVFAAFADLGVEAVPIVFSDDAVDAVRERLLGLDGVLVWVNPIEQGLDRSKLDALLRDVAREGVWVSAHPDVILRIATKKVLVDTHELGWGTESCLYASAAQLRGELVARLVEGPRVLKQQRGMGGHGVWKVELDGEATDDPWIVVEHANGGAGAERLRLSVFVARCEQYFVDGGLLVDQPFQERIGDGLIRVYLTHNEVVGFAHQFPRGLRPASAGEPPPGKRFELPTAPAYARLRELAESRWVPEMQELLGVDTYDLPVIWDADFLFGPKDAAGNDTYVLCEINASSTFAFPEHAMARVARAALDRIAAND